MKKLLLLLTFIASLFIVSCQTELLENDYSKSTNGFSLSYSVSGSVSAVTRSSVPIEDGEDRINSFYILFFKNTSGGTGEFIEAVDAMDAYENSLATTGILDIEFPAGSALNGSTDYKMLLCANIKEYIPSMESIDDLAAACAGKTENAVVAMLQMEISGVDPTGLTPEEEQSCNDFSMSSSNLPMSASIEKKAKQENISVELIRTVSRFDVFCQDNGYELVSASIWNAYTKSNVWPTVFNDWSSSKTERYYGVSSNQNKEIVGSLYAFENYVPEPVQNDKVTTCLIIGLENKSTGEIEYFRANINATNIGQQLKRNNVYRTTVRSVNSKGAENERKAYEDSEMLIDLDINGWTLDDSGNIHHDGDNILAIPTSTINLSSFGDSRSYNVFTLGEGKPQMEYHNIPDHISVKLDGNQLLIDAQPSNQILDNGVIIITFGNLKGEIAVNQVPYETDFLNLSTYELPVLPYQQGVSSQDIEVTSSGRWIAEIHNGEYLSFGKDSFVPKIEGEPGEKFNLNTLIANNDLDLRYSFVLVKLESDSNISRVVIAAQAGTAGQYLIVNPTTFPAISGGGGYTSKVSVMASGNWTATLSIDTDVTSAVFVEPMDDDSDDDDEVAEEATYNSWDNSMGNAFAIRVNSMTALNVTAEITVTVQLEGSDLKEVFKIRQTPLSPNDLIFQTRIATGNGSVFNLTKPATYKYAYQLATNMRNANLFGPANSAVVQTSGEYIFLSGKAPSPLATIYQVTGAATKTEIQALKPWWEAEDNRILFFSNNITASVKNYTNYFNSTFGFNYKVTTGAGSASNERCFVPDPDMSNKLIKYLLDGPFGTVNPDSISLKSKNSTNRSLSTWPDTFVPLILTGNKTANCILGIDPVNRVIYCTDPGIFGCRPTSNYPNKTNFDADHKHNTIFLNNLIAWMTNAAMYGDDFLKDFR